MIKQRNYYFIDGGKNRWSKETHTKEEAEAKSKTLLNCTGCVDCSNCTDSHRCYDSTGLVGCSDLVMSSDSIDCRNCSNVHRARGISFTDDYTGEIPKTSADVENEISILIPKLESAVHAENSAWKVADSDLPDPQLVTAYKALSDAAKAVCELSSELSTTIMQLVEIKKNKSTHSGKN